MAATQKPLSFSLCPENIEYVLDVVAKQKETNRRYNKSVYMDDLITHLRTKAEVKPKLAKTNPTTTKGLTPISFPINLDIEAWDKWIKFRKAAKFKAYKTDAAMKKLAKSEFNDQMLMVQQSIDNEYQGLFALKGVNNGHQGTGRKESSHERIKRENDLKYRGQNECGLAVGANDGHLGRTVGEGERELPIARLDNTDFIDY